MQVAKRDKGKKLKEDAKRQTSIAKEQNRKRYVEELKQDEAFQTFVVAEWQKEVDKLLDIRNWPNGDYEEMGKFLAQMKIVTTELEKMIAPYRRS